MITTSSKRFDFTIAVIIAGLFFCFSQFLLRDGHFHEDAYILFVYVENVVNGHGISFYPGGVPTEGATDFLWMVILIGLAKIGVNVGTATIFLNSVGVFLISLIISLEISKSNLQGSKAFLIAYLFMLIWLFQPTIYAAIGGFSVFLYMSLILLGFVWVKDERYVLLIPILSLTIALFRPDGVIVGAGYTFLGFFIAYRQHMIKQYLLIVVVATIVGIGYFYFRYTYFNNLLPLPLYVKSHGALLSGLAKNISWLFENILFVIPAVMLACYHKKGWLYLRLSLPVILLFIALITATQSQNVGMRFQGPIFIVLYFVLLLLTLEYLASPYKRNKFINRTCCVFLVLVIINSLKVPQKTHRLITEFNYINQAPVLINKNLPINSTIALTEAGRLAYWNQKGGHRIVDLVGLNTEYPALNIIDVEFVESLDPDMVMFHQAGTIDVSVLAHQENDIINISDEMSGILKVRDKYEVSNYSELTKVKLAAVIANKFLAENFTQYDIFFIKYGKRHDHIYAFKKSLGMKDTMQDVFEDSFKQENKSSYYSYLD
jgi:hypothetical protein